MHVCEHLGLESAKLRTKCHRCVVYFIRHSRSTVRTSTRTACPYQHTYRMSLSAHVPHVPISTRTTCPPNFQGSENHLGCNNRGPIQENLAPQYPYVLPLPAHVPTSTCTCPYQHMYMSLPAHVHVPTSTCTCPYQHMYCPYQHMYCPYQQHMYTSLPALCIAPTSTCTRPYQHMYCPYQHMYTSLPTHVLPLPAHVHVPTNTCIAPTSTCTRPYQHYVLPLPAHVHVPTNTCIAPTSTCTWPYQHMYCPYQHMYMSLPAHVPHVPTNTCIAPTNTCTQLPCRLTVCVRPETKNMPTPCTRL